MVEVEEPRVVVVGVGLEIEQVVDLVWCWYMLLLVVIEDIECKKYSISIWGDLKRGDLEIIGHPLEERM